MIKCGYKDCSFRAVRRDDLDDHIVAAHMHENSLRHVELSGPISYRPDWEMLPEAVQLALLDIQSVLCRETDYHAVQITISDVRIQDATKRPTIDVIVKDNQW